MDGSDGSWGRRELDNESARALRPRTRPTSACQPRPTRASGGEGVDVGEGGADRRPHRVGGSQGLVQEVVALQGRELGHRQFVEVGLGIGRLVRASPAGRRAPASDSVGSRCICTWATVIDCRSRRLAGWAIGEHIRTELVAEALTAARDTRGSMAAVPDRVVLRPARRAHPERVRSGGVRGGEHRAELDSGARCGRRASCATSPRASGLSAAPVGGCSEWSSAAYLVGRWAA